MSGGRVDLAVPGPLPVLSGWAPGAADELVVVVPGGADVLSSVRLRRADLPAGSAAGPDVGFRVLLRSRTDIKAVCVLARSASSVVRLDGSAGCGL